MLRYFLLVFALSAPFWLVGAVSSIQLMPSLPVSALAFVCPAAAAAILVYRRGGGAATRKLLLRAFDASRVQTKIWYIPIVLFMPLIMTASFFVTRLTVPTLPIPAIVPMQAALLFVAFFVAALGEELGWTGYVLEPLQKRFGAFRAALILGVAWAVWHFIPLTEAHRTALFIAWWSLGTVATRLIMVWLYNSAGKSVFAAALFHAMINVSWQLYPINGSYYDPRVTGSITAVIAIVITAIWMLTARSQRQQAA